MFKSLVYTNQETQTQTQTHSLLVNCFVHLCLPRYSYKHKNALCREKVEFLYYKFFVHKENYSDIKGLFNI
jgi:hypothetical protein